jgi:hypothetical protein
MHLQPSEVLLLLTPATATALGALMQGLGRRYGAAFNRRHGRRGTLWAGRFRTAVVQAGPHVCWTPCCMSICKARPAEGSADGLVQPGPPPGRAA